MDKKTERGIEMMMAGAMLTISGVCLLTLAMLFSSGWNV